MTNLRSSLGVIAATTAITAAGIGTAAAATHTSHGHAYGHTGKTTCAIEQAQVDKAQAKLDVLTAKFAAAQKVIKADKAELAATTGHAKGHVKKELAADVAKKVKVVKAKKAQVQRLAHATARLNKCLAGLSASPSTSASGSATSSASASPSTSASTSASSTPTTSAPASATASASS
jgi:uncharacterized protein (DUF342 family)